MFGQVVHGKVVRIGDRERVTLTFIIRNHPKEKVLFWIFYSPMWGNHHDCGWISAQLFSFPIAKFCCDLLTFYSPLSSVAGLFPFPRFSFSEFGTLIVLRESFQKLTSSALLIVSEEFSVSASISRFSISSIFPIHRPLSFSWSSLLTCKKENYSMWLEIIIWKKPNLHRT